MGNALGFVRMVRSGGLRATASAIRLIQLSVMISYLVNHDYEAENIHELSILSVSFRFVPDLTDIPAFAELATAEGLGPEAVLLIKI